MTDSTAFSCPQVRSMISDFAVFLTIVVMVLLDYVIGVPSQKLKVPSKFQVWRRSFYTQLRLTQHVK